MSSTAKARAAATISRIHIKETSLTRSTRGGCHAQDRETQMSKEQTLSRCLIRPPHWPAPGQSLPGTPERSEPLFRLRHLGADPSVARRDANVFRVSRPFELCTESAATVRLVRRDADRVKLLGA